MLEGDFVLEFDNMGIPLGEVLVANQLEDEIAVALTMWTSILDDVDGVSISNRFAFLKRDFTIPRDLRFATEIVPGSLESRFLLGQTLVIWMVQAVTFTTVDHALATVRTPPSLIQRRCELTSVLADGVVFHLLAAVRTITSLCVAAIGTDAHLSNTSLLQG